MEPAKGKEETVLSTNLSCDLMGQPEELFSELMDFACFSRASPAYFSNAAESRALHPIKNEDAICENECC